MRFDRRLLGAGLLLIIAGIAIFIFTRGSQERGVKREKEPEISVYFHDTQTRKNMPLEEYLVGVVAGEMEKDWPVEAYGAQAIVARSFTLEFLSQGGTKEMHNADICTDEKHAQAYNSESVTSEIRRAVEMTRGKIMTYNGDYVKGWFSASCGGKTAPAVVGLGYQKEEPAYITSVDCPEEGTTPEEKLFWSADFSWEELAAILGQLGEYVGEVKEVQVGERHEESSRVSRLDFVGTESRASVKSADFRTAAGPERLRSIWITDLDQNEDGIIMKGRGFGHGVGLCQWGAHALALEGKNPEEIVKHYYPGVEIEKAWE